MSTILREISTNAQADYPKVTCDASRTIASTATRPPGGFRTGPYPISLGNSLSALPRALTLAHSRNTARGKRGILFCYAAYKTPEYMLTVALVYRLTYCNVVLTWYIALAFCRSFPRYFQVKIQYNKDGNTADSLRMNTLTIFTQHAFLMG